MMFFRAVPEAGLEPATDGDIARKSPFFFYHFSKKKSKPFFLSQNS
jgi:hypothetical protein